MPLDAQLWEHLQEHGVYEYHLRMLLRLLQVERQGYWGWHYAKGRVVQCDARFLFSAREEDVDQVSAALFEGDGVVR